MTPGRFKRGGDRKSASFRQDRPITPSAQKHKKSLIRKKRPRSPEKKDAPRILQVPGSCVCLACHQNGIIQRAASTPSYSNVEAKRAHRQWAMQFVADHWEERTAALFFLDDLLPKKDTTTNEMTYFTDDLIANNMSPHYFFSPNIKAHILKGILVFGSILFPSVEDLRARGVIHTEQLCACLFLQLNSNFFGF